MAQTHVVLSLCARMGCGLAYLRACTTSDTHTACHCRNLQHFAHTDCRPNTGKGAVCVDARSRVASRQPLWFCAAVQVSLMARLWQRVMRPCCLL